LGRGLKGEKPADVPVLAPNTSTSWSLVSIPQKHRAHASANLARSRRRGDRIVLPLLHCMSLDMCRFSDACMTTHPHALTAGVRKAPMGEIAIGGATTVRRALPGCDRERRH